MSFLTDIVASVFERRYRSALSDVHADHSVEELAKSLLSSHGEVSGSTLALLILDRYTGMEEGEKKAFFDFMTHDLEIDATEVTRTLQSYKDAPSKTTYRAFAQAAEPPRQELTRRLNQVPGATERLVALRKDLLKLLPDHPDLEPLDVDLQHLFKSWFNRGFLELRPVSWASPAEILEKIIAYEAVHAIDSWDALRGRVEPQDRRCFAFFHPAMPQEPLIFVEVALTQGIPNSVQDLLADGRDAIAADEANTAVFYSISNCQAGLAGISFGNSLIKQVVTDLARDLPSLKNFVTLSPIPGLNAWRARADATGLSTTDAAALAAHYLLEAKRDDGMPLDPVARFHLGNGAMVHAVHADADTSENGMRQSDGTMVNYLYDLSLLTQNHEHFITDKAIAASNEVISMSQTVKLEAAD